MQSKLSRNSCSRESGSSNLRIHHNIIMEKETLTHGMKDKERKENLKRASSRRGQRRVT
jgi:hypothetical protein